MRRPAAVLVAAALVAVCALFAPARTVGASAPRVAAPWTPIKGIAVDLASQDRWPDSRVMEIGASLFATIRTRFHANAVSLNFPFWQRGSRSNDPVRGTMTPSPSRLAMLTVLAEHYGLAVQYRPYLFEDNLRNQSRPSITPTNVSLWFRNYWGFLQPYLVSAAQAGASSFSVALEMTSLLPYLSEWERVVAKAKTIFPGAIIYSQQHDPQVTVPLTERGYDAYQPIVLKSPRQVSVAAFTRGFIQNFQMAEMQETPRDLIVEELGIPAVAGSYLRPNYFHYPPSTPVDRRVQADWFAGACNAFYALHLKGLYFWSVNFNTFKPTENDSALIYPWLGTATANVVAACFARHP